MTVANLGLMARSTLMAGLALLWAGCSDGDIGVQGPGGGGGGGGGGDSCVDGDGDGYGRNCGSGVDCDDSNPTRNAGCDVTEFGPDGAQGFDEGGANGVVIGPDGALTLGEELLS